MPKLRPLAGFIIAPRIESVPSLPVSRNRGSAERDGLASLTMILIDTQLTACQVLLALHYAASDQAALKGHGFSRAISAAESAGLYSSSFPSFF